MKTSEAAKRLAVSPATVRNYSRRFAEYLSDSAARTPRQFTEQDLSIMAVARDSLAEGNTYDDVAESLALVDMDRLQPLPEPEPEPTTPSQTALGLSDQFQDIIQALVGQWQAIAEERRLEVERLRAELAEARKPWWQRLLGR